MARTGPSGRALFPGRPGVSSRSSPSQAVYIPAARSRARLFSTSVSRGVCRSRTGPSHKRLAARMGSTLFLAGGSQTSPSSRAPPQIFNTSPTRHRSLPRAFAAVCAPIYAKGGKAVPEAAFGAVVESVPGKKPPTLNAEPGVRPWMSRSAHALSANQPTLRVLPRTFCTKLRFSI